MGDASFFIIPIVARIAILNKNEENVSGLSGITLRSSWNKGLRNGLAIPHDTFSLL